MRHEYLRVIREARPKFFVFENVKGLTNAALKHISYYERVAKREEDLEAEQRLGTAFQYILGLLRETGYIVTFRVLNAADYGTPQKRRRLIIFGSRDGIPVGFPEPTHDDIKSIAALSGLRKPWATLRDALAGLKELVIEYLTFLEKKRIWFVKFEKESMYIVHRGIQNVTTKISRRRTWTKKDSCFILLSRVEQ